MPRTPRKTMTPDGQPDYSPSDLADLLHRSRSWVYTQLDYNGGSIQTFLNAVGRRRISAAEYERVRLDRSSSPLSQAAKREQMRALAYIKRLRYTRDEIAEQLRQGKWKHYANLLDPAGLLGATDPAELEEQIQRAIDAQLAMARSERYQRLARAEKHKRRTGS
jgi:hypothetical protein